MGGTIRLNGATSGYVELTAPAVAGSTVLDVGAIANPGMVLVGSTTFSAASTVSVDGCFTSAYDNYKIVIDQTTTSNGYLYVRMRSASTDASAAVYSEQMVYGSGATMAGSRLSSQTQMTAAQHRSLEPGGVVMDLYAPAKAAYTRLGAQATYGSAANTWLFNYVGVHVDATAYDGITFYPSAGTTTGSIQIYGYSLT